MIVLVCFLKDSFLDQLKLQLFESLKKWDPDKFYLKYTKYESKSEDFLRCTI